MNWKRWIGKVENSFVEMLESITNVWKVMKLFVLRADDSRDMIVSSVDDYW